MSRTAVIQSARGRLAKADENLLVLYLKEINKVRLLTREEEQTLAREAAQGSTAAKEKLVRANLRFVVNIAKKYQHKGFPWRTSSAKATSACSAPSTGSTWRRATTSFPTRCGGSARPS